MVKVARKRTAKTRRSLLVNKYEIGPASPPRRKRLIRRWLARGLLPSRFQASHGMLNDAVPLILMSMIGIALFVCGIYLAGTGTWSWIASAWQSFIADRAHIGVLNIRAVMGLLFMAVSSVTCWIYFYYVVWRR